MSKVLIVIASAKNIICHCERVARGNPGNAVKMDSHAHYSLAMMAVFLCCISKFAL
jgi:hypothetical protein